MPDERFRSESTKTGEAFRPPRVYPVDRSGPPSSAKMGEPDAPRRPVHTGHRGFNIPTAAWVPDLPRTGDSQNDRFEHVARGARTGLPLAFRAGLAARRA
jgi:hypothetical protein